MQTFFKKEGVKVGGNLRLKGMDLYEWMDGCMDGLREAGAGEAGGRILDNLYHQVTNQTKPN
jgi:hypothetical protein